jgi:hypothetical protein
MAASVLSALPAVAFFLVFQRYVVHGIVSGRVEARSTMVGRTGTSVGGASESWSSTASTAAAPSSTSGIATVVSGGSRYCASGRSS